MCPPQEGGPASGPIRGRRRKPTLIAVPPPPRHVAFSGEFDRGLSNLLPTSSIRRDGATAASLRILEVVIVHNFPQFSSTLSRQTGQDSLLVDGLCYYLQGCGSARKPLRNYIPAIERFFLELFQKSSIKMGNTIGTRRAGVTTGGVGTGLGGGIGLTGGTGLGGMGLGGGAAPGVMPRRRRFGMGGMGGGAAPGGQMCGCFPRRRAVVY